MARTSVTVTSIAAYQVGTAVTETAGDASNDHSVSLAYAPKLILLCRNTGANTIAFTIEYPAGKSTYNAALSRSVSMTNAQLKAFVLDVPPDLVQSGNVLHIDSADANFGDLRFSAFTWADTPWR